MQPPSWAGASLWGLSDDRPPPMLPSWWEQSKLNALLALTGISCLDRPPKLAPHTQCPALHWLPSLHSLGHLHGERSWEWGWSWLSSHSSRWGLQLSHFRGECMTVESHSEDLAQDIILSKFKKELKSFHIWAVLIAFLESNLKEKYFQLAVHSLSWKSVLIKMHVYLCV